MASIVPAIPFAYAVPSPSRRRGRSWAIHEPDGPYRAPRPTGRAAAGSSRPRASDVPPPWVGLQYGDRLVCVRYRYDPSRSKRFKTVELIVAERDWQPPRPRLAPERPVSLQIAFAEVELRRRVKQAGGTWNPDQRVWQLPYDRAVALGLGRRIVDASASTGGCLTPSAEHLHADT